VFSLVSFAALYEMNKRLTPAYLLTFVNVLGFSILMPILPFVVERYGAPEWVYGLLLTFYSAFQYIGAPYLGALSDSKGRKPILLISQAGTLLSWFVFLFALYLPDHLIFGISLPLIVIAFSRILDGITGGNVSVTNAYVADITTMHEKSYIFGYLGGIAGIGLIIGPGLGGISASTSFGFVGTLLVAIVISSITLIIIYSWVKESHPVQKRSDRKRQPIINNLLVWRRIKRVQPKAIIKLLFLLKFFFSTMMAFYIATIALFLIDLFDFREQQLGLFMLVVGIFLSFNQAFVSRRFIRMFGEYKTLLIGLSCAFLGLFSITLTDQLWLFILFYYIMNLGISLSMPTFNALIAIHANQEKQGEVMGISESLNALAMALFPVIAATIYGLIGYHVYYFMSALPLTALIIAIAGSNRIRRKAAQ
jgi:MFS family permease